jgi:hypothetical protein
MRTVISRYVIPIPPGKPPNTANRYRE